MSVEKSKVRFTKDQTQQRNSAREMLARPDESFPDSTTAAWHKSRANGIIRRTYTAAKARAAERDKHNGNQIGGQNSRRVDAHESDCQRRERLRAEAFIEAIREGTPLGEKYYANLPNGFLSVEPRTKPAPVAVAGPRVTLTSDEKYCEKCQIEFEICGCARPQPTSAALIEQAKADDKDNAESRDDLTMCPLCLVQRRFCEHSGRAQGAA